MSNYAPAMLQKQFSNAHDWLNGTFESVTDEMAHWSPEGLPSPIGAQYIHVATAEDIFISGLQGKKPLLSTNFAGNLGVDELPPKGTWNEWACSVKVNVEAARAYGQAVFEATYAYLASLTDETLYEKLTNEEAGIEDKAPEELLVVLLLNVYTHAGEISALKGLQGEKGYPA